MYQCYITKHFEWLICHHNVIFVSRVMMTMTMMMISVTTCFLLPVLVMSFVLPFSHIPIKKSWRDDVSIHPLMMLIGEGDVVNDHANVGSRSQSRRRDRRINDDAHDGGGSDETVAVNEKSIEQAMYDLFIQQLAEDFGINHGSSSNSYDGGGDEDDDRVDDDDDVEDVKMNALEKLSVLPARRLVIAPTVVTSSCVVEFILNNRLTIGNYP